MGLTERIFHKKKAQPHKEVQQQEKRDEAQRQHLRRRLNYIQAELEVIRREQ